MNSKTNGEADEDCLFLENVLDKLYDFGKCSSLTVASFTRPPLEAVVVWNVRFVQSNLFHSALAITR